MCVGFGQDLQDLANAVESFPWNTFACIAMNKRTRFLPI